MQIHGLTPARALNVITPPGVAISIAPAKRGRWSPAGALQVGFTLAWNRGSAGAARMDALVYEVAEELLGPDAPLLIRSGDVWGPVRHGDHERPDDPRYAGKVFAEIAGDLKLVADMRNPESPRPLDLSDPATLEIVGPGSVLRVRAYLFAYDGCVAAQLAGDLGVVRGAPGHELWRPAGTLRA